MKRIIVIVLCLAAVGFSGQADTFFQKGVAAYQNGDYTNAIEEFEAVLELGQESAALYFNLGNAYYKNDEIGKAIVNYERAAMLDANDEDIAFNLRIAQLHVVDKIPTPEMDYFYKLWRTIFTGFDLNVLTILTLASYFLFMFLWIAKIFIKRNAVRSVLNHAFTPMFILLVLFAVLLGLRIREDLTTLYGIVLSPKIAVTSSPAADATEVFALHEGAKVKIIARSGEYSRIRLSDGKDGWVLSNVLEVI